MLSLFLLCRRKLLFNLLVLHVHVCLDSLSFDC